MKEMKKKVKKIVTVILGILAMGTVNLSGCKRGGGDNSKDGVKKPGIVADVMSGMYGAKGDGVTSDREIIQLAIDEVSKAGGGKVVLTAGHTFLSGNIVLRSNVELHFGDGATLLQNSDPGDYIEVIGFDYTGVGYGSKNGYIKAGEPYTPIMGIRLLPYDGVIWPKAIGTWRETWYWNYPLIYAGAGTENVKITGNGTIQSMKYIWNDNSNYIYINMFGFYKTKNILLSDIKILYEGAHCTNFLMCNNAVIRNVTMITPVAVAADMSKVASICDGLKLNNCQDFLVEGCTIASGDDTFLVMNTYGDTRLDRWASSEEIQPTKNIEIANNLLPTYFKGLGFCPFGLGYPDLSQAEISNIYIHGNRFGCVGLWPDYKSWMIAPHLPNYGDYAPMKNIRWENNIYDFVSDEYNIPADYVGIDRNLPEFPVSDQMCDNPAIGLKSMSKMRNADFNYAGIGYWIPITENGSIADVRTEEDGNKYGYLGDLEKGDAKLYQGIHMRYGNHVLKAKVKTGGGAKVRLFVRAQQDNKLLFSKEIANLEDWSEVALEFSMPGNSLTGINVRLGLERVDAKGWAMVDYFEHN